MHAKLGLYLTSYSGSNEDLEYYVRECGNILGITGKLAMKERSAKHVLEHVFAQLVEFKKLNQASTLYYYVTIYTT